MKRKLIFAFATLMSVVIFQTSSFRLQSHIVQPLEGGLAGDPGQTTCAHCHSTFGAAIPRNSQFVLRISQTQAGLANDSSIITPANSFYTPNYTQWVSIELLGVNTNAAPATPIFGFQLTALRVTDSMAGRFILVDPKTSLENSFTSYNSPVVSASDTIWYVAHSHADTTHTWYFKWTAPDSSVGNITFYYSGNLGDGYDVTQQPAPPLPYGDTIFTGSVTLAHGPGSTVGIANVAGNIHSASVYPVPFGQLLNADLYLNATSDVSLTLLSIDGQAIKELYNGAAPRGHFSRSFDIGDVASGMYFVRVQSGVYSKVIKVLKY